MRTLHTERLRLVPVTTQNADALWRILQEPGLREFQDLPDTDLAQFRRIVATRPARLEAGSWGRFEWLIYLEGVAEPVGWASLRIGERAAAAEVGYSVVQGYRGRGVATECARAVVSEAFARLQANKVRAYCVPENQASRAVLRRVGFEEDGILSHGAMVQGRPVDVLAFVLPRTRWQLERPA